MVASIWNPGSNTTQTTPASVPFSFVKGTVGNPGINFVGDTDTGIWSQADGYLNFAVNGVNKLTIAPTGEIIANEFVSGAEIAAASAATVDIGAVQSNSVNITGTSNISSFGTNYQGPKYIRFSGALTLANSGSLICPGNSNLAISAGDTMIVTPKATAGVSDGWVVISYIKSVAATDLSNTVRVDVAASGTPVILYTNISSRNIRLTGSATITKFTADTGGLYFITFGGASTLVNSTDIVTNTGGNILTQAGDTCILRATAYSVVEVLSYSSVAGVAQAVSGLMYGNRVINGAQEIDQTNSGAAVVNTVGSLPGVDMFALFGNVANKFSAQQVIDAPAGLKNSTKFTVTNQYSPAAGDYFGFAVGIEGKDVIDFQLGTAGAATITLSNWIKGSVAGTYSVALYNAAVNRSYIGTVSVTTSWTQVKITLQGDITGTWATDNTAGLWIRWDLGSGSNYNGTAGVWQAGSFLRTAGSVTFVNQVAGSTLNITGVDCRLGSVAPTVFERRPNELQLCQRYFAKTFPQATAPAQNAGTSGSLYTVAMVTNFPVTVTWNLPVTMRATAPVITSYNPSAANANWSANPASPVPTVANTSDSSVTISSTSANTSAGSGYYIHATASARLF